jgi:hypothetical protein
MGTYLMYGQYCYLCVKLQVSGWCTKQAEEPAQIPLRRCASCSGLGLAKSHGLPKVIYLLTKP